MFRELYIEAIREIAMNMGENVTRREEKYIMRYLDINKPLTGVEEDKIANLIEEVNYIFT